MFLIEICFIENVNGKMLLWLKMTMAKGHFAVTINKASGGKISLVKQRLVKCYWCKVLVDEMLLVKCRLMKCCLAK